MTLSDLYWSWRGRPSTATDVTRVLRLVRRMGRESEAASALTEDRVAAYLAEVRALTSSDRTHQNHVVTVRAFLNHGVRVGALPFNPMWRLLLPVCSKRIKASHPRVMRPDAATRAQSLGSAPLSSVERRELVEIEEELRHEGVDTKRPRTLAQCPPGDAPCPFASCRHSLLADPGAGVVKLTWPGRDVDDLLETCSLRAARRFAIRQRSFPRTRRAFEVVASADEVASLLNLTPMRISQIEDAALAKLRSALEAVGG